jgi:hypothetical protein
MNVFGAPISNLIGFNNYERCVTKTTKEESLEQIDILKLYSIWGLKKQRKNIWGTIKKDDVVIFYRNKFFISYCRVLKTVDNLELSEKLWEPNYIVPYRQYKYPLLILMSNPTNCKVSFEEMNKIIGYKKGYFLRSFFKLKNLDTHFKSFADFEKYIKYKGEVSE